MFGSVRRAALNLHPSLLPRYRGPDPVGRQLEVDDRHFGVTLHLLDNRFDRGDIVSQAEFETGIETLTQEQIEWRCAQQGVGLFVDAVHHGCAAWRVRPPGAECLRMIRPTGDLWDGFQAWVTD